MVFIEEILKNALPETFGDYGDGQSLLRTCIEFVGGNRDFYFDLVIKYSPSKYINFIVLANYHYKNLPELVAKLADSSRLKSDYIRLGWYNFVDTTNLDDVVLTKEFIIYLTENGKLGVLKNEPSIDE